MHQILASLRLGALALPFFSRVMWIEKEQYRAIEQPAISSEAIKKSLDLLLAAEKPLIVSGGGVSRASAWNELREFSEYLQLPVMETLMGVGTLTNKSKCLIPSW